MDIPPFPPAAIVAARDAAKAHLRLSGSAEDILLGDHAATALALAEAFTGVALIVREREQMVATAPGWALLEAAPVRAIETVEGVDTDNEPVVLPVGSHAIDIGADGEGRVRVMPSVPVRRVRVRYLAGLAEDWAALPAPVRQGVTILTAHLFEARLTADAPPAAVTALWRPWRRVRIAA